MKAFVSSSMRYSCFLLLFFFQSLLTNAQKSSGDYYLVRIYHCSTADQVSQSEEQVGLRLLPFLRKNGIRHTGVFLPLANDTAVAKRLIVWIPLKDLRVWEKMEATFGSLDPFGTDPLIAQNGTIKNPPYVRIETMLASAFAYHPRYNVNSSFDKGPENIYEFRSYESASEALHLGKVHMFNQGGEIDIFKRLNFNAVFYGRVIAGARMPNLIYMTSFRDMADRNQHWNAFRDDPAWKALSPQPPYAGNVSRNETILLKPSRYNAL
jgi:hypothetical protein